MFACKLFENTYEDLMESWGKSAKRAEHQRIYHNVKNTCYNMKEQYTIKTKEALLDNIKRHNELYRKGTPGNLRC